MRENVYKTIEDQTYKKCPHCGELLLRNSENFYQTASINDGLACLCKSCKRKQVNEVNQDKVKNKIYKYVKWTDSKLEELKSLYATTMNKDLAKLFNTTAGAIQHIGCREKLKKTYSEKK